MALDGFRALLFVPPPPEILADNDSTLPFAPHSPIKAFTQCHLK